MKQQIVFVMLIILCNIYLISSAPNPYYYDSWYDDYGRSSLNYGSEYYDSTRYSRYPKYKPGPPYYGKYRYPHFYPPIAVLAG